jgi:hypothetical protein
MQRIKTQMSPALAEPPAPPPPDSAPRPVAGAGRSLMLLSSFTGVLLVACSTHCVTLWRGQTRSISVVASRGMPASRAARAGFSQSKDTGRGSAGAPAARAAAVEPLS